jgi:hypothetical protein
MLYVLYSLFVLKEHMHSIFLLLFFGSIKLIKCRECRFLNKWSVDAVWGGGATYSALTNYKKNPFPAGSA